MDTQTVTPFKYQAGGSLSATHPTYVERQADQNLYQQLRQGEFCYVLNSRQMGKSSLRVRTMQKLEADGYACVEIDLSGMGSQVSEEKWYTGLVYRLMRRFSLPSAVNWRQWWKEHSHLSPVQRFGELLEVILLPAVPQNIVIFLDEIDGVLSFDFPTDDFFALIRYCYNQRVNHPNYHRLCFCLLGVATPAELIQDKQRTPFNIGRGIELTGFTPAEAVPILAPGLRTVIAEPEPLLTEVLNWTGGQPFLTQKLCRLILEQPHLFGQNGKTGLGEFVGTQIIENWESKDQPEHLKTIRDRVIKRSEKRASYLLELYQQIWQNGEITAKSTPEEAELQLSGLVVNRQGKLQVYNPIYQAVFNDHWIKTELASLRPYAETFQAWKASNSEDDSRLLRGQALAEAEAWAADKDLSFQDQEFLAASREKQAELEREKKEKAAIKTANQLLTQANQKAQKRIKIGSLVLVATLLGALGLSLWSAYTTQKANQQIKQAEEAVEKAEKDKQQAKQEEANAIQALANLNQQFQTVEKNAKLMAQKATEASKKAAKKQQEATQAQQQAEAAQAEVDQAQLKINDAEAEVQISQQRLQELEDIARQERQNVEAMQQQVKQAEAAAKSAEEEAQKIKADSQALAKQVKTVNLLAELGSELANQGNQDASDEAFKIAGLSFEIQDEDLRQAMLFSSTAMAYQWLDKPEKAIAAIESSLFLLKERNSQKASDRQKQIFTYALSNQCKILYLQQNRQSALEACLDSFNAFRVTFNKKFKSFVDNKTINRSIIESLDFFAELLLTKTKPTQKDLRLAREATEFSLFIKLNHLSFNTKPKMSLAQIDKVVGKSDPTSAVIYPIQIQNQLHLIIKISNTDYLFHYSTDVSNEKFILAAAASRSLERLRYKDEKNKYIDKTQELYDWLIKPIEPELSKLGVESLLFVPGVNPNLNKVPIAAFHDGEHFLIEKYSIGYLPGLLLTDVSPVNLNQAKLLAVGASDGPIFNKLGFPPVPAVETELLSINNFWQTQVLLNQELTAEKLKKNLLENQFEIIHFAGLSSLSNIDAEDQFILLYDSKLDIQAMEKIDWGTPPPELIIMGSCGSVKNDNSNFGFDTPLIRAGVKSVLGAYGVIDDRATALFMIEFHRQLQESPTKIEALRRTQIAMIEAMRQAMIEAEARRQTQATSKEEIQSDCDLNNGECQDGFVITRIEEPTRFFSAEWAKFSIVGNPW